MTDYRCPVHGNILLPATSVLWNGMLVPIEQSLGIYECPEGGEYYILVDNELKAINAIDIVKKQKEHTELVKSIGETSKIFSPLEKEAERIEMVDRILSDALYPLTVEESFHRAYSVEEIIEACNALGFHPKKVKGRMIGFVQNWLFKNKGQFREGEGVAE